MSLLIILLPSFSIVHSEIQIVHFSIFVYVQITALFQFAWGAQKDQIFRSGLHAPQVGLEPTTLRLTAECSAIELLRNMESGGDLLSRTVTSQVPSALKGLTSVFGMGTGGTPSSLPPEMVSYSVRAAPWQLHSILRFRSTFLSLVLRIVL